MTNAATQPKTGRILCRILRVLTGIFILLGAVSILLAAVALVLLFSVLPVPEWKLRALSFFVPLSFSVYIIHEHPLVRSFIIRNSMLATLQLKPMLQLLVVLGCAVKIWLLCSGLDWLRVRFFRWLRVEKALLMLERFLASPPKKI